MKRICKECEYSYQKNDKVCPNCGNPLPKNKIPFVIVSVIVVLILIAVLMYVIPVFISNSNYDKAVECEKNGDLSSAIAYYEKVISWDKSNYDLANKKIIDLKAMEQQYKFAAECLDILIDNEPISKDSVNHVMISVPNNKCTITAGGVGYMISGESTNYDDYVTTFYDASNEMYITKFVAQFKYNGFSTSLYNSIRQETTDVYYEMQQLLLETVETDLVIKYYDELS